ncbi:MAG TPA: response regulator [Rhizomicrobium sp.]|jgi:DNA-binding response OmpR family regulator|nr:response regulator [Rhizomicrobium sp.]
MSAHGTGDGRARILVAEDEFLVYLALEDELRAKGYDIVGPFGSLDATRAALKQERVDLVLLDINMGGHMAWPIADELIARNIPFIFLSGYAADTLPERYRAMPRLAKPYDPQMLQGEIRRLLAR